MEGDVERSCTQSREVHFNPLPPHGGRHRKLDISLVAQLISIHSLRMEGDPWDVAWDALKLIISIHSLRMEGDCRII